VLNWIRYSLFPLFTVQVLILDFLYGTSVIESNALCQLLKYQWPKMRDSDIPGCTKMTEEIHEKVKEVVEKISEELMVRLKSNSIDLS
jgi:hypothetical protein